MCEEWRQWVVGDYDGRPKEDGSWPEIDRFEDEWCATCLWSNDGDICWEGWQALSGFGADWLLMRLVDGIGLERYCLRHPQPPRFREPECGDLFEGRR